MKLKITGLTICCATDEYLSVEADPSEWWTISFVPMSFASFLVPSLATELCFPDRSLDDDEEMFPDALKNI